MKKTMVLAALALVLVVAGCAKESVEPRDAGADAIQTSWGAKIGDLLARETKDSAWREEAKSAIAGLDGLQDGEADWSKAASARLATAVTASLDGEVAALEARKESLDAERKSLSSQMLAIQAEVMDCARESADLSQRAQAVEDLKERLRAVEAFQAFLGALLGLDPEPDPEVRQTILDFTTANLETSQGIDLRLAQAGQKLADLADPWRETVAGLKECEESLFALQLEQIEFRREYGTEER